ncbi:MAG: hypothetical protein ABSG03_35145 [Bryobacteraceae bacterium]|jgi:hypothetical protein
MQRLPWLLEGSITWGLHHLEGFITKSGRRAIEARSTTGDLFTFLIESLAGLTQA